MCLISNTTSDSLSIHYIERAIGATSINRRTPILTKIIVNSNFRRSPSYSASHQAQYYLTPLLCFMSQFVGRSTIKSHWIGTDRNGSDWIEKHVKLISCSACTVHSKQQMVWFQVRHPAVRRHTMIHATVKSRKTEIKIVI